MERAKRPNSIKVNGLAIWEYLVKQNLAQNELAKRLGISSGYMAQLISGSRSPSPKLRCKMLDVLSPLSFGELFCYIGERIRREGLRKMSDIETAVLSVSECAKMLEISRGSAYQGVLTGEIPHIKIGRRILIPRVAIQKLLESAGKPKDS